MGRVGRGVIRTNNNDVIVILILDNIVDVVVENRENRMHTAKCKTSLKEDVPVTIITRVEFSAPLVPLPPLMASTSVRPSDE